MPFRGGKNIAYPPTAWNANLSYLQNCCANQSWAQSVDYTVAHRWRSQQFWVQENHALEVTTNHSLRQAILWPLFWSSFMLLSILSSPWLGRSGQLLPLIRCWAISGSWLSHEHLNLSISQYLNLTVFLARCGQTLSPQFSPAHIDDLHQDPSLPEACTSCPSIHTKVKLHSDTQFAQFLYTLNPLSLPIFHLIYY